MFVALGLLSAGGPVSAHHSTAMYDMANPVTVTGTVKRFEWTNPHAFIYLDVKDEKGNVVEWEIEMMSLNHLRSYGWMRDTVKAGEQISCTGGRAEERRAVDDQRADQAARRPGDQSMRDGSSRSFWCQLRRASSVLAQQPALRLQSARRRRVAVSRRRHACRYASRRLSVEPTTIQPGQSVTFAGRSRIPRRSAWTRSAASRRAVSGRSRRP